MKINNAFNLVITKLKNIEILKINVPNKTGNIYFFDKTKLMYLNSTTKIYLSLNEFTDSKFDISGIIGYCNNFRLISNVLICDIDLFKPFNEKITHFIFYKLKICIEPFLYGKRTKQNEIHIDYITGLYLKINSK